MIAGSSRTVSTHPRVSVSADSKGLGASGLEVPDSDLDAGLLIAKAAASRRTPKTVA
jgi:hypothetical protein